LVVTWNTTIRGAEPKRGLAVTKDVPGDPQSRLEAFVALLHQRAIEPLSICLDQSAGGIRAIEQSRDEVSDAIICRVGLAIS
jgi:hypothetical protein